MKADLKSTCHNFKFKVNTLNLFLPIGEKRKKEKRLGKLETETLCFKTRMNLSPKQIDSLSTLASVKP